MGKVYPGQEDLLDKIIKLQKRIEALERPRLTGGSQLFRTYPTSEYTTPPQIIIVSAFTSVYRIEGKRQHRRIYVKLRVDTPSGTTGTVRLRDNVNGLTLWSFAIPSNFSDDVVAEVLMPDEIPFGSNFVLEIEAQRLTGTGNVRVGVGTVYGFTS